MKLMLPVFLMTFYYGVYHIWVFELFRRNKGKRVLFQCMLWLLYASVLVANRAVTVQVFAGCWNGETLFFAGMLPFAVWLLLRKGKSPCVGTVLSGLCRRRAAFVSARRIYHNVSLGSGSDRRMDKRENGKRMIESI